jgi:hypothetical protein
MVPHSPQEGQRPIHCDAGCPHAEQASATLVFPTAAP